MQTVLDPSQRKMIPRLILYKLSQKGKIIQDPKIRHHGDSSQLSYQNHSVWHRKHDLDEWLAMQLRLPYSLWGPKRCSNALLKQTTNELAKLRKKGIVADWSSTKRTTLFRLTDSKISVDMPVMSIERRTPVTRNDDQDMKMIFLAIISKSRNDGTYKFALGKTLLDYCKSNPTTGRTEIIKYEYLAGEFLKHYWHQKYKFKMKQDFHTEKTPLVIQVLEDTFGENPPYRFKDADKNKLAEARKGILENVFGKTIQNKGVVIQAFQHLGSGNSVEDTDVFYDYDDDEKKIFLKPKAHEFFKQNYGLLTRALLAEWIKYLERVNHGLPMLAAKIDNEDAERSSLAGYRKEFLKYSNHCFYCQNHLRVNGIHVDHFIPWSYIFDNNAWNLVLACPECNLRKSSSLPEKQFIGYLVERDQKYYGKMAIMHKSLDQLSIKGKWAEEIRNHYKICREYGFGNWRLGT